MSRTRATVRCAAPRIATGQRLAAGMAVALLATAGLAPLIANHRPYVMWNSDRNGWAMPLFRSMYVADWLWLILPILALGCVVARRRRSAREGRLAVAACGVAVLPVVVAGIRELGGDGWLAALSRQGATWWICTMAVLCAFISAAALAWWLHRIRSGWRHAAVAAMAAMLAWGSARLATIDRPVLDGSYPLGGHELLPPIPHDWADVNLSHRLQAPGTPGMPGESGGGAAHLLGTDAVGADVLARLIHATRTALAIGVLSAALAVGLGALMGLCMGYFGGAIDLLGMRLIELFMAVPRLLAILVVIVFLPSRDSSVMLAAVIVVIGLTGWMRPARLLRAEVQRVRGSDYVLAARATGVSHVSVLTRHILPNTAGPVLVDGGFAVAAAILMETNLSFLGVGVQAPLPSWGAMLSQAISPTTGAFHWWMAVGPGVLIAVTVLSCNTLAESARRRLAGRDVRTRQ